MKDKVTVGESALKVVVPEKCEIKEKDMVLHLETFNEAICETLSTPLPDVNSCVDIELEEVKSCIWDSCGWFSHEVTLEDRKFCDRLAKAIANSKSILKWKKVDNEG